MCTAHFLHTVTFHWITSHAHSCYAGQHTHKVHFVKFCIIFPTAPSIAPNAVSGRNTSSTSLTLSWRPLTTGQNGIITGYTVYYRATGPRGGSTQSVQLGATALKTDIFGLLIYTSYNISVSAWTNGGQGPPSTGIIVTTGEASKFTTWKSWFLKCVKNNNTSAISYKPWGLQ